MGSHLTGPGHFIRQAASNWLQVMPASPVVVCCGWPFFIRGWQSVIGRDLKMSTLIAIGAGVAWIYSIAATLAPEIYRAFRLAASRPPALPVAITRCVAQDSTSWRYGNRTEVPQAPVGRSRRDGYAWRLGGAAGADR